LHGIIGGLQPLLLVDVVLLTVGFLVLGVALPYPGGTVVLTGLITAGCGRLLVITSDLTCSSATTL
jgi:hypothetical protein